jgi:glycosyltransferase involved in cell wall biosynthesis
LLPVRNEEGNITECIAALKSQSGVENLKFIVINDQSTDKTTELLTSAIAGDSRFTVLNTDGPRWMAGKGLSTASWIYEAAEMQNLSSLSMLMCVSILMHFPVQLIRFQSSTLISSLPIHAKMQNAD